MLNDTLIRWKCNKNITKTKNTNRKITVKKTKLSILKATFLLISSVSIMASCSESKSKEKENTTKAMALPVYTVERSDAVTVKDYLGTIEGKVNVEVRPQVEGLLQEIYVDEGAYVQKRSKTI